MARLAKGIFKRELATLAGVSTASVSEAFNSGNVGLRVARSIARVLELDMRTVLKVEAKPERKE